MSKNKEYKSVSAMLNDVLEDCSALTADEFDQYVADRKVVKDLAVLRSRHEMSQEELANKLGRTQSWVSKLENGTDDELNIGDLRAYLSVFGYEFRAGAVKQGATIVDEVKLLAFAIRQKLSTLAEMAKEGDGLVEHIANFFGEAFLNINKFLNDAAARLPRTRDNKPYVSIITMIEEMSSLERKAEDEDEVEACQSGGKCLRKRRNSQLSAHRAATN
jgi:transcriptional regulator with XRE-family HTH domain